MDPQVPSNFDIVVIDSLTPVADVTFNLGQDLRRFLFGYFQRVRLSREPPYYDDEAATHEYMRTYVEENAPGSTATWVDLPGRPTWTNYFSLGGTTDTVTKGISNFKCGDLITNQADEYTLGSLVSPWNWLFVKYISMMNGGT
jgi:hypothetical protein